MSSVITKSSKKKGKRQVNEKNMQFRKGLYKKQKRQDWDHRAYHNGIGNSYTDCIKSRRDKIGITRHIMMHQVLYIVQLPNDMHIM